MAPFILVVLSSLCADAEDPNAAENAESCLARTIRALALCKADLHEMAHIAEDAAERLSRGGSLLIAGQPSLASELCGRAGGLLMARKMREEGPGEDDVVLFGMVPGAGIPDSVAESGALCVVFGANEPGPARFSNHSAQTGISNTLANVISAWVFTAELIGASLRDGKMPVVLETIGLYDGAARNARFAKAGATFHDDCTLPPQAPGVLGARYLDAVAAILRRVETEHRARLEQIGAWAQQARASGQHLRMYTMGHFPPTEVAETAIGRLFESAGWNAGFRTHAVPEHGYAPGDLVVHIGYQHPPTRLLAKAVPVGARVAYVSVRPHRDYVEQDNVIWLDPVWPWSDAVLDLEDYDVPILPASGIVNAAIAWEIYRYSGTTTSPK